MLNFDRLEVQLRELYSYRDTGTMPFFAQPTIFMSKIVVILVSRVFNAKAINLSYLSGM